MEQVAAVLAEHSEYAVDSGGDVGKAPPVRTANFEPGTLQVGTHGPLAFADGTAGLTVELSGAAFVSSSEAQCSAEALLRDVVAFLRARPSGLAPSGLVVDAFQDRVGPTQHALFRRLLKVAATLEKNPPNAAGAGGGAAWVLKDEFR